MEKYIHDMRLDIKYIQDWANGGNEPRMAAAISFETEFLSGVEETLPEWAYEMLDKHEDTFCQLSPAGLAIAALANEQDERIVKATNLANHWLSHDGAIENDDIRELLSFLDGKHADKTGKSSDMS